MIDYSDYILTKKERINFLSMAYVVCFLVGYLFYHNLIFSLIFGFFSLKLQDVYIEYKGKKRREILQIQFKDLLYSLSASFGSGRQMPEALKEARDNLSIIYEMDSPIITELNFLVNGLFNAREKEGPLLLDFARRSHIDDINNFIQVYLTCRTTGGDVEKAVLKASEVLMDKLTIEREIGAIVAQKKLEGNIIGAMPLILLLFLNIFSPSYIESLYEGVVGPVIMSLAIVLMVYAYRLIMKLTDLGL